MGDIADVMPKRSQTVQAIFNHYKKTGDAEPRRGYLGASQIGHPCDRYLWYSFHWCGAEDFDGRLYRLFDRGDMEEYRMVHDLRTIGCEIHDVDATTGKQFEVKAVDGHFSGHMDGCALGVPEAPKTWHVLEFKTHNAKSFAELCQNGVRAAKKMHYDQMMVYMHLTGMTRALYLACNKDTDDLYSERVRYDEQYAKNILFRAERIIRAEAPPAPIEAPTEAWEKSPCRYCNFANLCHGTAPVAVEADINCRTCAIARPLMDGSAAWHCRIYDRTLSSNDQRRACPFHLFHPHLITFAKGAASGENGDGSIWAEYQCPDGRVWRNGPVAAAGQYSSRELTAMPAAMVGVTAVGSVKTTFSGEVVPEQTAPVCLPLPEGQP